MDPFARKMLRGAFAYAMVMLLMFAILTVVYFHLRPACPDRVVGAVDSPDRKWTAAIFERRCGEESPFISHVNLRAATQPLSRGFFSGQAKGGGVFLAEQDAAGAGLAVTWTAPDELTIACPRCDRSFIRQTDAQWGTVRIHYEIP